MKVAMLTTVGERCGIAEYTSKLVAALRTLPKMEVVVVPITVGKQPLEHYEEQSRLLNAEDIDLIHIQHEHSFWGGILPGHSAFWEMRYLLKKPVVITAHTTYGLAEMLRLKSERRPHMWLAKKLLTLRKGYRDSVDIAPFSTSYTIVHTLEAAGELIRRGAHPTTIAVIPAGIPETFPAPLEGKEFREKYNLTGKRVLTLFGYLAFNKGYELTLEILPKLPQDVVFVIAGGLRTEDMRPYQDKIEGQIREKRLENRVIITGYLSDEEIADTMAGSDIVLVPHTQATGSYSVTVPLAYKMPIVASDLACFREIQERHACLSLFRAGDSQDYLAKVQSILDSPQCQQELRAQAQTYAEKFSWNAIAKVTAKTYRDALEVYGVHPKNFVSLSTIKSMPKRSP
jgi:glycosyltransferase involved in cell wall biosynthesis